MDSVKRKRAKWSRWADDLTDDDEGSAAERDCRRIVNEATILGTSDRNSRPTQKASRNLIPAPPPPVKKINALPVPVVNPQPQPDKPDQRPPSQPAVVVRRAEDDVLTVFCDDEIADLNQRPETPEIEIIAVTKPKERPKLPDLRETLNKKTTGQTLRDRPRAITGKEVVPRREYPAGREIVSRRENPTGREVVSRRDNLSGREVFRRENPTGRELFPRREYAAGRENAARQEYAAGREVISRREYLAGREGASHREYAGGREVVARRPRDIGDRSSSSGFHGYHPYNGNRFPPYNGPGRTQRIELSDVCRSFRFMGGCARQHCKFIHRLPQTSRYDSRFEPPMRRPALPPPPGSNSREHQAYPSNEPECDGRERPRFDNRSVGPAAVGSPGERGGANRFQHGERFEQRPPTFEQDQRKQEDEEEKAYTACMQELLKQNGQLQDHMRKLEQQHHDLEIHAVDQHHDLSRRLERLADFQRSFVMHIWRNEPALRQALEGGPSLAGNGGNILQRSAQNGILGIKPAGQQEPLTGDALFEAYLARQLIFQRRLQNGLGLTEEQLLLQHGVLDNGYGTLLDQYWRYS